MIKTIRISDNALNILQKNIGRKNLKEFLRNAWNFCYYGLKLSKKNWFTIGRFRSEKTKRDFDYIVISQFNNSESEFIIYEDFEDSPYRYHKCNEEIFKVIEKL